MISTIFTLGMLGINPTNFLEDAFKSLFGEIIGAILWILILGIIVGMVIATAIAYYNSCLIIQFLPVYCTCY